MLWEPPHEPAFTASLPGWEIQNTPRFHPERLKRMKYFTFMWSTVAGPGLQAGCALLGESSCVAQPWGTCWGHLLLPVVSPDLAACPQGLGRSWRCRDEHGCVAGGSSPRSPKGWAAVYVARIRFGLGKAALDVWVPAIHVLLMNCAVCLGPPALLQQSPSSPTS